MIRSVIAGVLALMSCSRDDGPRAEHAMRSTTEGPGSVATVAANPCAVFTKEELESALALVLDSGVSHPSEPTCRYVSSTGDTVTVSMPTAAVSPGEFDSWRAMAGAQAERLTGVGDDAYLWRSRLYLRVGERTLTISLSKTEISSEMRSALTTLGRSAAAKLK